VKKLIGDSTQFLLLFLLDAKQARITYLLEITDVSVSGRKVGIMEVKANWPLSDLLND
jgi:hypothetical protein